MEKGQMAEETTGAMEAKNEAETGTDSTTTAPKESTRDELASQLVDRLSLWSGAAGGILPPLVDMVGVGGVQLYMLRRLSEIYGVPFSKNVGKSVVSGIGGRLI